MTRSVDALLDATALIALAKRQNSAELLEAIDRALVGRTAEETVAWLAHLAAQRLGKGGIKRLATVVAERGAAEFEEEP